ncbi:peroxisomal 2 4-dienoyl-CoA reductase sps19 [Sporothrix epigloea]|uniref:2,4-dienoyl-CoA reductase [(3E)-enoyl-CoA-producing] n=1 Tax=Sporothrix epigloea TaxID=1892477 RepID=A0ABP0D9R0_9PEZI
MSKQQPHEFISPVWRDGIFRGRVVFVTGGAGDICSAQTRALVYLGADAFIIGRNVEKTEAAAIDIAKVRKGARVMGIGNVDVRNFETLQKAADRCVAELGSIDFVIAGAAGNFISTIAGLSPKAFKSVMDIDTIGTFNTIKATIDHLSKSAAAHISPNAENSPPGGRFIAVSATFHYTGVPLQSHASAAKAGVDSLVSSVALEYGPRGVMANVIAPGPIEGTEGMDRLARAGFGEIDTKDGKGQQIPPSVRGGSPTIPSGRWGTVRDIADATVYLFSAAADNVNGHVLVVDGGAWRRQGGFLCVGQNPAMQYPNFLLSGAGSGQKKPASKI